MANIEKNIHSGHRQRLREQLKSAGLYNVSDIHFLEYLLTFVIKRADTNPIAHALLDEFGSIPNIFNASTTALCNVKGVGKQTANFLQYMSVAVHMYNKQRVSNGAKLDNMRKMVNFIINILPPSDCEQFVVIILNKNYTVKDYKIFKGVSHSFISIDKNELSEFLINHKASFIIFAHTHPNHKSSPSMSDINTFQALNPLLNALAIVLIENLIIGDKTFFSFKFNKEYDIEFDDDFDNSENE